MAWTECSNGTEINKHSYTIFKALLQVQKGRKTQQHKGERLIKTPGKPKYHVHAIVLLFRIIRAR